MSTLSAQQRGDLAEEMLPVACHLTVLIHGDGGPQDVAEVLAGLDPAQKDALLVVLAGLVDPEQPVGKALGWLDFNEHGSLTVPSWSEERSVRDLVPEPVVELDDDFIDETAVSHFVKGFPVKVNDVEFLDAVQKCVAKGMSLGDIDALHSWPARQAENWVNRLRKRYQRSGREFPSLVQSEVKRFTEQEVLRIRTRSAEGASDIELALTYGTTRETIRSVCRGISYRQYGGPIRAPRGAVVSKESREYMCGHADNSQAGGYQSRNAVLTPQDREVVRERASDGEGVKELASEYEVSTTTIRRYAA